MTEPQAQIARTRRIPAIWLVPIVAGLLGIWMVVYAAMSEGPDIDITFSTAEGIEAGKTKVKARNVQVGLVEEVQLNEDLESVTIHVQLDPQADALLRTDTRFWVVRPRIGAGGISGLGTLLSGAYIELEPGSGESTKQRRFKGLDDVPVTPVDAPGLNLYLLADRAGSVGAGDPILYRGFPVGKIEETNFDAAARQVRHRAFIIEPYGQLVDQATRFWNASGVALDASASGVRLEIGSLQSLLSGGVAFDVPEGFTPAGPVEDGVEYFLYDRYQDTLEKRIEGSLEYVVEFAQSVRGLVPGAPVEYRGIRVGSVQRIMIEEMLRISRAESGNIAEIPVLITVEPARLSGDDSLEGLETTRRNIRRDVEAGIRASLQTGNLLTGSLFVSLDYHDEPGEMGEFAGYTTLPTVSSGLGRIERQISGLLTKINSLPLDDTVRELNGTLNELRRLVASEEFGALPGSLNRTLRELESTLESIAPESRTINELNRTLQSLDSLLRTLDEKPNSLIFKKPVRPDPEPGRGR